MSSHRPSIPDGFLGAQPRFSELRLETESHRQAEFEVQGEASVVIRLKANQPVKVVTKLTHVESDRELPEHVLVQRRNKGSVHFYVSFPLHGHYKFMIFALDESDPSDSLPNVFNYLINVTNIPTPAQAYGKAFTKSYTDCCYLEEPLVLNSSSEDLSRVTFRLTVPDARKVAVHCVQEWFHLSQDDHDLWECTADLSPYKGKESKVKVMANYEGNDSTYNALFEFTI